ncbi:hypothetical protein D3C73_1002630 [compost metagenome]
MCILLFDRFRYFIEISLKIFRQICEAAFCDHTFDKSYFFCGQIKPLFFDVNVRPIDAGITFADRILFLRGNVNRKIGIVCTPFELICLEIEIA